MYHLVGEKNVINLFGFILCYPFGRFNQHFFLWWANTCKCYFLDQISFHFILVIVKMGKLYLWRTTFTIISMSKDKFRLNSGHRFRIALHFPTCNYVAQNGKHSTSLLCWRTAKAQKQRNHSQNMHCACHLHMLWSHYNPTVRK